MITRENRSSGFLFGAMIGAVLGVLFAKKPGHETREQLGNWWRERSEGFTDVRETAKTGKEGKSSWGYQEPEGARSYQKSAREQ